MRGDSAPVRKFLRFEDWPEPDRLAWQALFAEGDIFEDAGLARHWRPATCRTNWQHYARWLGWLALRGGTSHAASLRVTQSATRSSPGPSYGLPGQPAKPRSESTKVDRLYPASMMHSYSGQRCIFSPALTLLRIPGASGQ